MDLYHIRMIALIMGTTGSGKTTVGQLLAAKLHWEFADADDFHSSANIAKMKQGIALSDADRRPWLAAIRGQIAQWLSQGKNVVLACSALKQDYREELLLSDEVKLIYLKGDYALIAKRLQTRLHHFADEQLLASQFATLEEPCGAISIDINHTPAEIVNVICQKLSLA